MASSDYTGRFTPALTPAAVRVLDVASQLFYDRGIHAVGVDTIAEAAQVTKKTIYDRFRSKDNLISAYLERRDQQYRQWLTDWVNDHSDTEPLLAVFDALHRWMAERGPRGCAFVNAYAELADPGHPAHRIAREQKAWLCNYLHDLAASTGHDRPDVLANQLLALHEGAIVLYSAGADPHAATTAQEAATTLLQHQSGATADSTG